MKAALSRSDDGGGQQRDAAQRLREFRSSLVALGWKGYRSIAEEARDLDLTDTERGVCKLQATWDGQIFHDALQNVRISLPSENSADPPSVELVEPVDDISTRFLRRGGGLHHLCYEVDSLDEEMSRCGSEGLLIVKQAMPAAAFGGRRIFRTLNQKRLLVEWLEGESVS